MRTSLRHLNLVRPGSPLLAGALCSCVLLAGAAPEAALAAGKGRGAAAAPALAAPAAPPAPAEAEFEVVAPGDEMYRLLAAAQRGGLLASAPRSGATRYEMALETGRAALSLAAKRAAQARVGEEASRALGELLTRLRPELRRLDVDVDAALALCRGTGSSTAGAQKSVSSLLAPAPGASGAGPASASELAELLAPASRSLSQKLRLSAYRDSRARSLADPFGGPSERGRAFFGPSVAGRGGEAVLEPAHAGPRDAASGLRSLGNTRAGASLGISDWLRVRAGAESSAASTRPGSLRALGGASPQALLSAGDARAVGGGLDIEVAGLTLSGDLERARSLSGGGFTGTRIGTQAKLSAFNDQLTLSLNLSRLLPEERERALSTAGASLGIGDKNSKLVLLYQQLFGPASGQPNRVIAGGVNITF